MPARSAAEVCSDVDHALSIRGPRVLAAGASGLSHAGVSRWQALGYRLPTDVARPTSVGHGPIDFPTLRACGQRRRNADELTRSGAIVSTGRSPIERRWDGKAD